jgi:hypothetical protein
MGYGLLYLYESLALRLRRWRSEKNKDALLIIGD